jgi:hypothetical protein
MRRKIALVIVGFFFLIDALAWVATYRAATAPSPEELQLQAGATPLAAPSIVEARGDGMTAQVSLNGEWRYRQTGSELASPSPSQGEPALSEAEAGRGEGWTDYFSPDLDTGGWHTMTIPQNWYLSGLNYHGVIWFRREFQADDAWRGRAVRLRFDGVDYLADVWLNGMHMGHHEGYFQPLSFDVAEHLNYGDGQDGGRNVLAVRVESPYEEHRTAWPHRKTLVKGVFAHHDTRPGGGWDRAGQEYNTGGIWNDVALVVSDYVTVDGLQLRAQWPGGVAGRADPVLTAEAVLTNHADQATDATVTLTLTPRNFQSGETHTLTRTVTLRRGVTTVALSGTIPGPRLWWPWDRGAMFVEHWPSITWAVVDYYRQPKAGYYALQAAMQPIPPSIAASRPAQLERERWVYAEAADFQAALWIVNDTPDTYSQAQLRWRVEGSGGEPVKDGVAVVNVPSDGVRWAAALRNLDLPPGAYDVQVELHDAQGRGLGRNGFAFAVEPPEEEEKEEAAEK